MHRGNLYIFTVNFTLINVLEEMESILAVISVEDNDVSVSRSSKLVGCLVATELQRLGAVMRGFVLVCRA